MTTALSKSIDKKDAPLTEWMSCVVCGGFDAKPLFTMPFKGVDYQVVKCRECGMVYLNPRLTVEGLRKFYPSLNLQSKSTTMGLRVDPGIRPRVGFRSRYIEFYDRLAERLADAKVLDFVCRNGSFLEMLRERYGWEKLYGVENRKVLAEAAGQNGFQGFYGTVEQAKYSSKSFDLVVMRHTLEHLYEPRIALREVRRIMKDSGYLRVEVPHINSLSRVVSGRRWSGFYIPWHLYYFSLRTLTRFLESEGFVAREIFTLPYPHYFLSPLRYLRFTLRKRATRNAVGKTLDDSPTVGAVLYPLEVLSVWLGKGDELVAICQKA